MCNTEDGKIGMEVEKCIANASKAFGSLCNVVFKNACPPLNLHRQEGIWNICFVSSDIRMGMLDAVRNRSEDNEHLTSQMCACEQ